MHYASKIMKCPVKVYKFSSYVHVTDKKTNTGTCISNAIILLKMWKV